MAGRISSRTLAAALLAVVLGSTAALPCAAFVAACGGCCCPHDRDGATEARSRGCCEILPAAPGPPPGVATAALESASRADTAATPLAVDPPLVLLASSGQHAVETAPTSLDPPPRWLRDCAFLI